MKALTLTQPWATLIAIGAKRIETRSWGTDYHGQIAIHAAKGLGPVGGMRGLIEQCEVPAFANALRQMGHHEHENPLPRGAIVAVAVLDRVRRIDMKVRAEVVAQTITPNEIEFGNYETGRYAWFLESVLPLAEPIPCNGALSLWDVPEEVNKQILIQLEGLAEEDLNEAARATRDQQIALNLR